MKEKIPKKERRGRKMVRENVVGRDNGTEENIEMVKKAMTATATGTGIEIEIGSEIGIEGIDDAAIAEIDIVLDEVKIQIHSAISSNTTD